MAAQPPSRRFVTEDKHLALRELVEDITLTPGPPGGDGKSAYDLAVAGGYVGTAAQWLASLKGTNGNPGSPGDPGRSAYAVAVAGGYVGSEAQWLTSLKGAKGDPGSSDLPTGGTAAQYLDGTKSLRTFPVEPTQAEAEAGVSSTLRVWSALRVWQTVHAYARNLFQVTVRWDSVAKTWAARPVWALFGVLYLSTNDPAATAPPALNLLTGDRWGRHPDAPEV